MVGDLGVCLLFSGFVDVMDGIGINHVLTTHSSRVLLVGGPFLNINLPKNTPFLELEFPVFVFRVVLFRKSEYVINYCSS